MYTTAQINRQIVKTLCVHFLNKILQQEKQISTVKLGYLLISYDNIYIYRYVKKLTSIRLVGQQV